MPGQGLAAREDVDAMPPSCRALSEHLERHARGALSADRRAHLETHLRGCGACRRRLALERRLAGLAPTGGPAPPDGLADQVVDLWAQQGPRHRLLRSLRSVRQAATRLIWETLVDPLLLVDYHVRGALSEAAAAALEPVRRAGALLESELDAAGALALAPLMGGVAAVRRLAVGDGGQGTHHVRGGTR
jgi:hypothetical protein